MGKGRSSGGFATAFALALALTACGGSTLTPKHVAPKSADELKAGLLPPEAFGSGMHFAGGSPTTYPDTPGDVAVVTQKMDCTQLVFGGDRDAAVTSADAIGFLSKSTSGFFERAGQYQPGDAAVVLVALANHGRAECAAFTDTTADTSGSFSDTSTVAAKPYLGDDAYLFEQSESSSGMDTQVSDTLTVEYGDVLVSVGCFGDQTEARACDLPAAAKKLAKQLKLT